MSRRGGRGEEGTCGGLCLRSRLKLRRRLTGTETVNMCTVRVTVNIPRPIAIRECAVQIGLRVDCSRQGQRREELQTTENRMVTQSVARDVKLK